MLNSTQLDSNTRQAEALLRSLFRLLDQGDCGLVSLRLVAACMEIYPATTTTTTATSATAASAHLPDRSDRRHAVRSSHAGAGGDGGGGGGRGQLGRREFIVLREANRDGDSDGFDDGDNGFGHGDDGDGDGDSDSRGDCNGDDDADKLRSSIGFSASLLAGQQQQQRHTRNEAAHSARRSAESVNLQKQQRPSPTSAAASESQQAADNSARGWVSAALGRPLWAVFEANIRYQISRSRGGGDDDVAGYANADFDYVDSEDSGDSITWGEVGDSVGELSGKCMK